MEKDVAISQLTLHTTAIKDAMQIFLAWFVVACTVNGTMLGLLKTQTFVLRTPIVHLLFVVGNGLGVWVAVCVYNYCKQRSRYITTISSHLGNDIQSPVASSVLHVAAIGVGVICVGMAIGWGYELCRWSLIAKTEPQTAKQTQSAN